MFDLGRVIQGVLVKKPRLSSKAKKGDRITLEADATHNPNAVYELLAQDRQKQSPWQTFHAWPRLVAAAIHERFAQASA